VDAVGPRPVLAAAAVRRVVSTVLAGERISRASISVTFLPTPRMRTLNRKTFGRDRATDVIAFGLPHDGVITGDIYVCPAVARRAARELDVSEREELIRLVVHGTLHVLGYDHPASARRTASPMWRRQERYVKRLAGTRQ